MKKKKLTKSEINLKLLNKYKTNLDDINYDALKTFKDNIKNLTDSRQKGKCKYKIWDIVVVSFLTILGNCNDWNEIHDFAVLKKDWLKNVLMLTGGIPSAATYKRVFSIIKPDELENICVLFVQYILKLFSSQRDIMNIDGKTDNGSRRNENEIRDKVKALNILNVYSNNLGLCVASSMIDDKTNEITAIPDILDKIQVKGNIITWDALNTQKANIEKVIKLKDDYVVPVKQNQSNFYDDLKLYFNDKQLDIICAEGTKNTYFKHIEKSHSSCITYEYFQTEDIQWYSDLKSWKGIKSFGAVKKTIVKNNNTSVEFRYYITSLYNDIETFCKAIR